MEATTAPRAQWTFAQWGIVVLAVVQLAWAVAGLIAEPTFDFGDGASTQRVLGVDFNGADAILHIATGALFAVVAAIQLGLDRRAAS